MWILDQWHDWFRLIVFITCLISLTFLGVRFWQHRGDWNTKTRDLWFSVTMWTITGASVAVQGILKDFDLQPAMVIAFFASITGLKALVSRDPWGGNENDDS